MSLILGIETSTTVCSVALTNEGATVAFEKLFLEKSHSSLLTIAISDLLRHAGVEKKDLSAVAVSKGPGSYTGLRIGVSTAKGICYAFNAQLFNDSMKDNHYNKLFKQIFEPAEEENEKFKEMKGTGFQMFMILDSQQSEVFDPVPGRFEIAINDKKNFMSVLDKSVITEPGYHTVI